MKSLIMGNEAVACGALKAGMTFFAAYPITPASEIMHELADREPEIAFIHAEDEIASIHMALGGSLAGRKAMVRAAKPEDCHAVNAMMVQLIDEIYGRESEEVRRALKANFTEGALTELCGEEHAVLYVVEADGRVVAFLYGWLFRYVLTIYWIYSLKEFRGKGVVKDLLGHAETELLAKGCWKLEMYAYAENNRFLDFCAKLGFSKGALIEKSMFGFKVQNIYKVIDESMCREESLSCSIQTSQGTMYGFGDVAVSLFGSKIYINMIALGRILRYIGVNILLLNIKELLPTRAIEKNLEAIKYGFSYRDDV